MTELHHGNLVNLYGVCTKVQPVLIVSELCRNGCLLEYLQGQKIQKRLLKWNTLLRFMAEVCAAMVYLVEEEVIHRDLAGRGQTGLWTNFCLVCICTWCDLKYL